MSEPTSISDAIARVPGWSDAPVEVLEELGGLTNRTVRVRKGDELFALRLNTPQTTAFAVDRHREIAILESVAVAGLGPDVVYADSDVLVSVYIDEPTWEAGDLSDRARLEQVGKLLHRVHGLPLSGYPLDATGVARNYLDAIPDAHDRRSVAEECVRTIEELHTGDEMSVCHNDVIASNIIGVDQLRLLDWEYACDNDPLFDLACLIEYHGLDDARADTLLAAYDGHTDPASRERLAVQRRIYRAFHALWETARDAASS